MQVKGQSVFDKVRATSVRIGTSVGHFITTEELNNIEYVMNNLVNGEEPVAVRPRSNSDIERNLADLDDRIAVLEREMSSSTDKTLKVKLNEKIGTLKSQRAKLVKAQRVITLV